MESTVENLTQPLLTSLSTAVTLCSEIKNNRHCGSTHIQLDLLETSLSDGSSLISAQSTGLEGMVVDEEVNREFGAYNTQLVLLCGRLRSIACPSHSHTSHHSSHKPSSKPHSHEHKHDVRSHSSHSGSSSDEKDHERNSHHKHHSNTKSLIFSAFEPRHHHHEREVEDPHFGELRGEWEGVSAGILGTLAGLRGKAVEGEESIVKEVEKVEIKEEGGAIEKVIKEVEKVEIKEGEVMEEVVEEVEKIEIKEEGGAIEEVVEEAGKIEIKEEGEAIEEVVKEVEKVEIKQVEKVEIKEEGGAIEEVIKEVEKVEIKEGIKKLKVVRYNVKHVEGKETETVVVEVEEELHRSHGEDTSPSDSGSGSEEGEEREILEVEAKEMEVRA